MSSLGKSVNSSRSTRTKLLAVFMSVLLVLTMFNMSAFATGDGAEDAAITTSEETVGGVTQTEETTAAPMQTTPASYVVTFETQDSYVEVLEQNLAGTIVNMPAGADLVFKAFPNTDYIDPVVAVSSSAHPTVPVKKEGDIYTIDSSYITDDSIKVKVTSSPAPDATDDTSEAQPITGTQPEDNGVAEDAPMEIQGTNENGDPQGGIIVQGGSDIPSNGSKTVSISILGETTEMINGVPTIVKPSGETVKARYSILSNSLNAVIIAIPKHPDAVIGLEQGDSRISIGTIPTQDLIDANIAVDTTYDEYFILTSNRSTSGSGDVVQFPTITFTFNNGTTPAGSIQPIEAYALDGVIDPANEILPGSNIAISATPKLAKVPDAVSTVIKAEVEEISLGKSIKEINDGGMSASGLGTDLDSRPFADSADATYSISYTLPLNTTRDGEEFGRLKIAGDFLIYDKLDNFRSGGTPTSIVVKGPKGETIDIVTPPGGKTETSWQYYFKATLDANGMVQNGDYTVTVTYKKDDYTDKYTQTTNLLGARQIITNSAWMKYTTQDGTTVDTSATAASVQNAIGYKQLSPDSLELKVQKMIQVKSGEYKYDTEKQAMYPEDADEETTKVAFTLTPVSGEGTATISKAINNDGVASLVGLKPNTTYTLSETQGIENFTSITPVTVVVGALVDNKVTITINGTDYYGGTYNAVDKAQRDGTIEVSVTKQDNTLSSGTLGDYSNASGVIVALYEVGGSADPIARGTTAPNGKVKFENLDPTKTYTLKTETTLSATLVPNEATVAPSDFNASTKDATAEIKYTSTYGAVKIAKNFVTASGEYANTASNLKATFRLVDKNAANYPNSYETIELTAKGQITEATLYNLAIPAGEYELYEYSVTGGTTSGQYVVDSSQKIADITIMGGKFDTYGQVLSNSSTYGQLKIQNFDYGTTGLANTSFKYTVSFDDNGTTKYINASGGISTTPVELSMITGQSEINLAVPSGVTYTVTQKSPAPTGFELVKNSGAILGSATVTVAQNTAASGVTVGGAAPNFTVTGGTQAAGFVNATLPNAEGTKVSVSTGNATLSGATFAVYKLNGSVYEYVGTTQSGNNGKISLTNLSSGEYRLIETTAPQGYSVPAYAQALASKVSAQANLTAAEGQQAPKIAVNKTDYSATTGKNTVKVDTTGTLNSLTDKSMIANSPLVTPEIQMVGAGGGGEIKGGQFILYSGSQPIGYATTDSSGYVKFTSDGTPTGTEIGLGQGTYTIKQSGLTDDAANYVERPDAVVTITVNAQGEVTSSGFTAGVAYARSETNGAQVIFSNAKKPSIKIFKLGETNVFETVEENGQTVTKRTEEPITGAVFTFADNATGQGLVIEKGKYTDQGVATEMSTVRGHTGVSGLDPNGTYDVTEVSAPDVEGTDLKRIPEDAIPQVQFEPTKNDQGQITGYQIKGQSQDGDVVDVWIKDSTLTIHDPAEPSYQIQVTKYGLGTANGSLPLTDPNVSGPYTDGVNAKFLIQKQVGAEWVTVQTITTGTSEVDNTGKLNLAISTGLSSGTYRIVEIQSGIYSPDIKEGDQGNSLYELTDPNGGTAISNWTKLNAEKETFTTPEGKEVLGLIWPEPIILGGTGHVDPDNPRNVVMGNDDERSTGQP